MKCKNWAITLGSAFPQKVDSSSSLSVDCILEHHSAGFPGATLVAASHTRRQVLSNWGRERESLQGHHNDQVIRHQDEDGGTDGIWKHQRVPHHCLQWRVLTPSSLLLQRSFLPRSRRLVWDLHSLAICGGAHGNFIQTRIVLCS